MPSHSESGIPRHLLRAIRDSEGHQKESYERLIHHRGVPERAPLSRLPTVPKTPARCNTSLASSRRGAPPSLSSITMREFDPLRMYGQPSDRPPPDWNWVHEQLSAAGTYWVTARTAGYPHPRPVWGIWRDVRLYLSIGTHITSRVLVADPVVTVHLDSGTDVVIVEGHAAGPVVEPAVLADYDRKYDWRYDPAEYGPLTCVAPETILVWRSAGWAGREGFQSTGRWRFS